MEHIHKCRNCHPELLPSGPRTGENHQGVRFNDWWSREEYDYAAIMVDGGDLSNEVYEAIYGEYGTAWIYTRNEDGALHSCPCTDDGSAADVCRDVVHGRVVIMPRALIEA